MNTPMKIVNTSRQKIDFSPPSPKKAKLPATEETTESEHPVKIQLWHFPICPMMIHSVFLNSVHFSIGYYFPMWVHNLIFGTIC